MAFPYNSMSRGLYSKLKTYGELVMFSHTLFSLPFAMISMLIAASGLPTGNTVLWILIALFAGRNGANALNRAVDAEYDALNPRTANRHIPSGTVSKRETVLLTLFCYTLFVIAASQINKLCLMLSPVALMLFTLYSYTKRYTFLCHLILGITCAGAPVGAWLAVTGRWNLLPLVLAAAVTLWVSGFDIIYGMQDIDFDRTQGLFSIPSFFGIRTATRIARFFHFIMWVLLIIVGFLTPLLSTTYYIAVAISGALLILEHLSIEPEHRKKMNFAAYHLNQVISTLLFCFVVIDIFLI